MIAVGAIIRFALDVSIAGIDLDVIGLILLIAGILGLLIAFFLYFNESRGGGDVVRERETVRRDRDRH